MNIPVGTAVAKDLILSQVFVVKMISDLFDKKFTGYISSTTTQDFGFEESIIIFKKGEIVGTYFKLHKIQKDFYSKDALNLILNSFSSKYGIIEIYSLSSEQVDLILTFNEKVKIAGVDLKVIKNIYKEFYDKSLVDKYFDSVDLNSKYKLFKDLGLNV